MKNPKSIGPFGLHLMIDAYNCAPEVLDDANVVYKILDELPGKIDMHQLTRPYVVHADCNGKKDPGGWSGIVMIVESHISVHTFVKRKFATIDVYSCTHFDAQIAINYFKKVLKTDDLEIYLQERGKKYPENNLI